MNLRKLGRIAAVGGFGLALLAGVESASAQNRNEEYREWQRAQREAQEERQDYMRTRSQRDYRDWQEAERKAREEYAEYTRANNNNRRGNSRFYRINRGGRYYQVDQRGVEVLRQAVNSGYQQGYNAGIRDRRYNRGVGYYNNDPVFRAGTYGYQSYVDRSQYQYYFQQGFERGYQDGYNNANRYGSRSGNSFNILGNVLNSILQVVDQ